MDKIAEYRSPEIELIAVSDILTSSYDVPEFEEDDNELPKLDW